MADDVLACLRQVPIETIQDVILHAHSAASSLVWCFAYYPKLILTFVVQAGFDWLPRVDGAYLNIQPMVQIEQGVIPNVTIATGRCRL